jgi:adenylate cyclase
VTKTPDGGETINGPQLLSWTLSRLPDPPSQSDGRTMSATILFTDIVDSTGLAARMGNRRWGEAVASYYEAVRREVQTSSGKVIHGAGDGFLIVFDAPTRAIRCARAIRGAVRNFELEIRAGLHTGEFEYLGSDIAGIAVHIAARVATTARPGEVLVTSTVKELLLGSEVKFSDRGIHKLKGVPEEWHLYRAESPGTASLSSWLPERVGLGHLLDGAHFAFARHWQGAVLSLVGLTALVTTIVLVQGGAFRSSGTSAVILSAMQPVPPSDIPSLAVLPFTNLSGDPNQEYFSDGITDELITMLSRIPHLLVIARTSTITYKNKPVKAQDIGRQLGVKYLLEGSARKSGNQVRIGARLVNAQSGAELWANQFDRSFNEIFAMQDQIVETIATTLNLQVSLLEQGIFARQSTNNPEAYDDLLRGLSHRWGENKEDDAKALKFFAKAIELDPNYADAYALMSATVFNDWDWQWTQDPDAVERSSELVRKALALDDSNPYAHVTLGRILAEQRQPDAAVTETERGLALNDTGNYYCSVNGSSDWAADTMNWLGRPAQALEIVEQAIRRDPINRDFHLAEAGLAYYKLGRSAEAIPVLKRFIDSYPPFIQARCILAAS